jgi:hypothetical protein
VNVSGTGNCAAVSPTTDTDMDGHDDAFPALTPGTPVCWDIHPVASNLTVQATSEVQVFTAQLGVYGDGSLLDQRTVYFVVPPDLAQP